MAKQTLTQQGAFTGESLNKVNANFTELYNAAAGGFALDDGEIIVGNGSDEGAAVAVSGDAELVNTGEVTVVGLNGSATAVTGAELTAAEAIIAAIPIVDPADGVTVWNDAGVLKVASPA